MIIANSPSILTIGLWFKPSPKSFVLPEYPLSDVPSRIKGNSGSKKREAGVRVFLLSGKSNFIVKTSLVAHGGRYLFSKRADLKLVLFEVVLAIPSP